MLWKVGELWGIEEYPAGRYILSSRAAEVLNPLISVRECDGNQPEIRHVDTIDKALIVWSCILPDVVTL
jgi:hypothetical protein